LAKEICFVALLNCQSETKMLRFLTLAFALGVTHAADQKITPVQSVINLLEKLEKQTIGEGKAEAAAYDKFACFCKEQADDKLYSITKKGEAIAHLTAEIKTLTADITSLDKDISTLNTEIGDLTTTCENEQKARDKEFAAFAVTRDDLAQAIKGCGKAIEILQSSKAPGALIQTNVMEVMQGLAAHASLQSNPEQVRAMSSLLDVTQPGGPAGSKFHSGKIVEVMQNTLKTFKVNKADLDAEEAEKKHTFDMAQGARKNQIKALEAELTEAEKESADKNEAKEAADREKAKTDEDKTADDEFLQELTKQCEEKAKAWDARSKTRAGELEALSQAIEVMKGEVAPVSLLKKNTKAAEKAAASLTEVADDEDEDSNDDDDDSESESFLQKKKTVHRRSHRSAVLHKLMSYLKKQSKALKSEQLSALMYKMKEDHFVKVRGMIKDMVAKLEADAAAEADQKAWCDEEMGSATAQRDENIGLMEGDLAAKTKAESFIAKTTEEVNALMQEIAEVTKGLKEAQELRSKEKAENTKTISDATAGLAGVTKAMKILKDFYDNAFVQVKAHYTPTAQDKMKDMAPATFEGENNGNQDAASGIIGMMDVIKSDFEASIEATKSQETENESEFQTFKSDSESDISEKEGSVKSKNAEITTKKADLQDVKSDLDDHTKLKEEALAELAKLKPACVDTGSDYEETVARREQEIESLKNAYAILDEMR
jgi:predicted  nucleic acid-binding Zn-ribbon protein